MGDDPPPLSDPVASVRRLVDSLLALARNRLQILASELQSEKERAFELLPWIGLAAGLGLAGFVLVIVTLALYLWTLAGYAGLLALAASLLLAATLLWLRLRARLRREPPPFADSIAEFQKDRACLPKND